jgi:hypothetical protein
MLQDPRTNPQNYGPDQAGLGDTAMAPVGPPLTRQPVTDLTAVYKDALDSLDPEEAYFLDSVAKGHQKRASTNVLLDAAMAGESLDSIRGQVQAAEASEKALRLAEESMGLSDQEFNEVLAQLQGEMGAMPMMPERGQIQQPDRLSQGLAAILSLASPQHAFSIGAVPYQEMARRRDEQYQLDVQRYGQAMANRKENLELLEMRLKIAEQRRREAVETLQQESARAYQRGEQRRAQALQARSGIYDAKTEAELDDRIRVMREQFPSEFLPAKEVIEGLRKELKAGAEAVTQKAKFDQEKEAADREATVLDDFRNWVNSQYPAGVTIGPDEVKAIAAEAKRMAEETGVKLSKFPAYGERKAPATESQKFQEQRYQDEAPDRAQRARNAVLEGEIKEVDLKRKKEALERELGADNSASGKARKKQIGTLTTKIENAKIALDQHLNQGVPDDEKGKAGYFAKVRELFIDEYTIVAKKRELAGGKAPTAQEYFTERFPNLKGLFGQIGGVEPEGTRRQMTDKERRQLGKAGKLGGGGNVPILPKGVG